MVPDSAGIHAIEDEISGILNLKCEFLTHRGADVLKNHYSEHTISSIDNLLKNGPAQDFNLIIHMYGWWC